MVESVVISCGGVAAHMAAFHWEKGVIGWIARKNAPHCYTSCTLGWDGSTILVSTNDPSILLAYCLAIQTGMPSLWSRMPVWHGHVGTTTRSAMLMAIDGEGRSSCSPQGVTLSLVCLGRANPSKGPLISIRAVPRTRFGGGTCPGPLCHGYGVGRTTEWRGR